ncbi:PAS domain S-box protein [Methanogenium sp. S4BF]|uniref:CHASE4 domain-containing protein n=1 Tax=Methanogenium sp. S4BF TaxID=1789226 RepID=UPI002416BB04|nr:CHASE4 domain-containing protein [Methanogenium sp. S4BF]WFN34251.1 PAS domain S-box protein [Methanogenium sp. S4BF]
MRVNTRNVLVICAVILAIGVAFIISSQYFLIAGIQEIETEEITGDLITAQHAIDRQGENLAVLASDYAGWDDTYTFISDLNPAYIKSNLVPETFSGIDIESILYFDTVGNLIYADSYDPETGEILPVSTLLADALQSLPLISSPASAGDELSGILNTPGEIWIFAAQPIRTSDRQSPSRGHLVMVSPFTSGTVTKIAKDTNMDIRMAPLPTGDDRAPGLTGADDTADTGIQIVRSQKEIAASTLVYDVTGKTSLLLTITSPRDTYLLGQKAVLNSVILFIIVVLIGSVFVYLYLGRHLTRRIENISRGVRKISGSASYHVRLIDGGNDELTAIVRSVNSLLDTIQTSLVQIEGAGRAREESERKYRHLFEAANEAIFILDGVVICECNRAAEEMTGCGRNDLTGKRLSEIMGTCSIDPDGNVLREHTEAAYAGEPQHFTCERHQDNEPVRHFSVSLSRFTGTKTVYLLAVVRDITTFVKNKEHLRITQFSVDNADDAIYWVKRDGSVTYGNIAACRSLGYTPEELTSLKTWDINPTLSPDTWPSVWNRIADGSRVHEESILKRSDNTAFPIAQTNSHLSTQGEEFTCIFARDMTETVEMREREKEALRQIEENLLSLAILNDHIRNPLTVISATADLHDTESREIILSQVDQIDEIVRKLDQGWLESAKIREFLIKHYDFEEDTDREERENDPEEK